MLAPSLIPRRPQLQSLLCNQAWLHSILARRSFLRTNLHGEAKIYEVIGEGGNLEHVLLSQKQFS